jgi:hypothetical protein
VLAVFSSIAVGAGAGGAAVAVADTGPSPTTYVGCLGAAGVLYNFKVNPTTTPKCLPHDQAASWNSTGAQGPEGPAGPAGPTLSGTVYGAQEWVGSLNPTANPDQGLYVEACPNGQLAIAASAWFVGSGSGGVPVPLLAQIAETNQFTNNAEIYVSQYAGTQGLVSWNITCAYVSGVADAP